MEHSTNVSEIFILSTFSSNGIPLGVSIFIVLILFFVINIYTAALDAPVAHEPVVYPLLYFFPSIYTYSSI